MIGTFAHFLDPGAVRQIALTPGTTMYRLVTDPLTGRCLERSTEAYRFDAAMRAQIRAADLTCRAPGCQVPGAYAQFDHVQEHGTDGGHTREANGALLHQGHHDAKTAKHWAAAIDTTRTVTWTSLLGKIYRTRAHDYTQYSDQLDAAIADIRAATETDRADLINDAVYAALTHRPAAAALTAIDDHLSDDHLSDDHLTDHDLGSTLGLPYAAWDQITLTHTDSQGERRYRPRTPLPEPGEATTASGSRRAARTVETSKPHLNPWNLPRDTPPPF